jgi:hypothetical protein
MLYSTSCVHRQARKEANFSELSELNQAHGNLAAASPRASVGQLQNLCSRANSRDAIPLIPSVP